MMGYGYTFLCLEKVREHLRDFKVGLMFDRMVTPPLAGNNNLSYLRSHIWSVVKTRLVSD
jgi:hypothetical protein